MTETDRTHDHQRCGHIFLPLDFRYGAPFFFSSRHLRCGILQSSPSVSTSRQRTIARETCSIRRSIEVASRTADVKLGGHDSPLVLFVITARSAIHTPALADWTAEQQTTQDEIEFSIVDKGRENNQRDVQHFKHLREVTFTHRRPEELHCQKEVIC